MKIAIIGGGAKVAKKLVSKLNGIVKIEQQEVFVTASIGIAIYPEDGEAPETLLMNADTAMYRAKERGKNNFQFFTSDMNTSTMERMRLENSLHAALARGELLLHYQPQVNVATGRIEGAEALVRWRHPERGLVPPSAFIPFAEQTGRIRSLTDWLLNQVAEQVAAWRASGHPLTVSINVAIHDLEDPDFPRRVAAALRSFNGGASIDF